MMKINNFGYILAALYTFYPASPASAIPQEVERREYLVKEAHDYALPIKENSARISISTAKTKYAGGEPIKLDITLKNVGTQNLVFFAIPADKFYQIEVIDPEGQEVALLRTYMRDGESTEDRGVTIFPNGSKTVRAWLGNIFDMTMEGKYKVTVSKKFRVGKDILIIRSESVVVEVTSTPTISEWQ